MSNIMFHVLAKYTIFIIKCGPFHSCLVSRHSVGENIKLCISFNDGGLRSLFLGICVAAAQGDAPRLKISCSIYYFYTESSLIIR